MISRQYALAALELLEEHIEEMKEYPVWVASIRDYLEREQ